MPLLWARRSSIRSDQEQDHFRFGVESFQMSSRYSCSISIVVLFAAGLFSRSMADDAVPIQNRDGEQLVAEHDEQSSVITDIVIILDSTSSMQRRCGASTRYDLARWVVSDILDVAPEGVNLGVLQLRDAVSELRRLQPMSARDRSSLRRGLWTQQPSGRGQLREALHRARTLLEKQGDCVPLFVVITDGEDCNCGEAHGAAAELVDATNGPATFLVVAPCQQGQVSQQLQSLAEAGRGSFSLADSRSSLDRGLTDVIIRCRQQNTARVGELRQQLMVLESLYAQLQVTLNTSMESSKAENEAAVAELKLKLKEQTDIAAALSVELTATRKQSEEFSNMASAVRQELQIVTEKLEMEIANAQEAANRFELQMQAQSDIAVELKQKEMELTQLKEQNNELKVESDVSTARVNDLQKTVEVTASALESEKEVVAQTTAALNNLDEKLQNSVTELLVSFGVPSGMAVLIVSVLIPMLLNRKNSFTAHSKDIHSSVERLEREVSAAEQRTRSAVTAETERVIQPLAGRVEQISGLVQQEVASLSPGIASLKEQLSTSAQDLKQAISVAGQSSEHRRERFEDAVGHRTDDIKSEVARTQQVVQDVTQMLASSLSDMQVESRQIQERLTDASATIQNLVREQADRLQQQLSQNVNQGMQSQLLAEERLGFIREKIQDLVQKLSEESNSGRQAAAQHVATILGQIDSLTTEVTRIEDRTNQSLRQTEKSIQRELQQASPAASQHTEMLVDSDGDSTRLSERVIQEAIERNKVEIAEQVEGMDQLVSDVRDAIEGIDDRTEQLRQRIEELTQENNVDEALIDELRDQLETMKVARNGLEARLILAEREASGIDRGAEELHVEDTDQSHSSDGEVDQVAGQVMPVVELLDDTDSFDPPSVEDLAASFASFSDLPEFRPDESQLADAVDEDFLVICDLLQPASESRLRNHAEELSDAGVCTTFDLASLSDVQISELVQGISGVGEVSMRQWRDAARTRWNQMNSK